MNGQETNERYRRDILEIFMAGLESVRGAIAVRRFLQRRPLRQETHLLAIGKAASDMALGALQACDEQIVAGLVITKHGHLHPQLASDKRLQTIESDHPVPGRQTMLAGQALLDYLGRNAKAGNHFLVLLSGGASSLVEAPVAGVSLDHLQQVNRLLLASGMEIGEMNAVRRAFSRIKGGRLVAFLNGCPALTLLISDVPNDDLGVIGSGMMTAVHETVDWRNCPQPIGAWLQDVKPFPLPDESAFACVEQHVVASLSNAKQACAEAAKEKGYKAMVMPDFIDGAAERQGAALAKQLINGDHGLYVWGGETSVVLPDKPGRGGRNQHLALAAALELAGQSSTYMLAAGTDGTDGFTDDAGGLVDGDTMQRGKAHGLDAEDCLTRADAGHFLAASGDLVTTGPTGTNVMDLIVGLRA